MSLQETIAGAAPETVPVSLADDSEFVKAASGTWERGQYDGTIVAEAQARGGFTMRTEDAEAETPGKRVLSIVVLLTNQAGEQRTEQFSLWYRPEDVTNYAVRKGEIKAIAERNKGNQRWDDTEAQSTHIGYQTLKDLQKNLEGFVPTINGNGGFSVSNLIGQSGKVNLGFNKKGFNKITSFRGFRP